MHLTEADNLVVEYKTLEIQAKLHDDPLLKRYLNLIKNSRDDLHAKESWMAAGERLLAVEMCLMPETEIHIPMDVSKDIIALFLAEGMLEAELYLWTNEIEEIALEAPLESHILSKELLPNKNMFWCHETCIVFKDDNLTSNWTWVYEIRDDFVLICFDVVDLKAGSFGIAHHVLTYGQEFSEQNTMKARVVKNCSFLHSSYSGGITTRDVPRTIRRERSRLKQPENQETDLVHTVLMRERERERAEHHHKQGTAGWHMKHRYWVKAHHRSQWYPSERAHHTIFIDKQLRGPEGAPMLVKVNKVNR